MNWAIVVMAYNVLVLIVGGLVLHLSEGWMMGLTIAGCAIPLPAWIYLTSVIPMVMGYFEWRDRYKQVASGAKRMSLRTVFCRPWVWFPKRIDLARVTPEELRERERENGQVFLGFIAATLFFAVRAASLLMTAISMR